MGNYSEGDCKTGEPSWRAWTLFHQRGVYESIYVSFFGFCLTRFICAVLYFCFLLYLRIELCIICVIRTSELTTGSIQICMTSLRSILMTTLIRRWELFIEICFFFFFLGFNAKWATYFAVSGYHHGMKFMMFYHYCRFGCCFLTFFRFWSNRTSSSLCVGIYFLYQCWYMNLIRILQWSMH